MPQCYARQYLILEHRRIGMVVAGLQQQLNVLRQDLYFLVNSDGFEIAEILSDHNFSLSTPVDDFEW